METINLEYTETVKKTKEVKLPVFRKGICHAYKVYSQEHCIQVSHGLDDRISIGVYRAGLAWNGSTEEDCTEEEFNELYAQTKEKLDSLTNGK